MRYGRVGAPRLRCSAATRPLSATRRAVRRANKFNEKMVARYEKSPYGGVDVWLIMGILAFVVPFGGLAVGLATGAIHTGL